MNTRTYAVSKRHVMPKLSNRLGHDPIETRDMWSDYDFLECPKELLTVPQYIELKAKGWLYLSDGDLFRRVRKGMNGTCYWYDTGERVK